MKKLRSLFREYAPWILTPLLIYAFALKVFIVPSESMEPTIKKGSFILVKSYAYGVPAPRLPHFPDPLIKTDDGYLYRTSLPERGEIVVFVTPLPEKPFFVKRIAATPGDEVIFRPGELWVHPSSGPLPGKKVTFLGKEWTVNPYGGHYDSGSKKPTDFSSAWKEGAMERKEDPAIGKYLYKKVSGYFMAGDNRRASFDSRFFGEVKLKDIIGKL